MSQRLYHVQDPGPLRLARNSEGALCCLWMGLPPPRSPAHRGLALRLDTGLYDGQPAWLEHCPDGPSIAQLSEHLDPAQWAMLFQDLAEALDALHRGDLHHGALDLHHARVDPTGQARLLGVGVQGGDADSDIWALIGLLTEHWPESAPPLPSLGDDAQDVGEAMEEILALHYPAASRASLSALSTRMRPGSGVEVLPWQSAGFDEVGMELGEERGHGGLLDFWSTGRSRSGAFTGAVEGTLPEADLHEVPGRGAILARLLAPPQVTPDPERFAAIEGQPLQALKALLAEEPLDPVPVCEGPRLGQTLQAAAPEDEPAGPTTVTSLPVREEVSRGMLLLFGLVGLALVLGALALTIALLR